MLSFLITATVAFFLGGACGFLAVALCTAARKGDEMSEKFVREKEGE